MVGMKPLVAVFALAVLFSAMSASSAYAGCVPAITIDSINPYVSALATVTGTASCNVASVKLVIYDVTRDKYWNGFAWVGDAVVDVDSYNSSTGVWVYVSSSVAFVDGNGYSIVAGDFLVESAPEEFWMDKSPPVVDAGQDVAAKAQFLQDASASDTSNITYSWSQVSGPGTITFGSPNAQDTTVEADAEGVYTARLDATDSVGYSAYDEFVLTWDTTSPTASITSPTEGSTVSGTTTTITATASDAESGIAKVEFWYASIGTKIGEDTDAPYLIDWDTTTVSDGNHDIWVVAI